MISVFSSGLMRKGRFLQHLSILHPCRGSTVDRWDSMWLAHGHRAQNRDCCRILLALQEEVICCSIDGQEACEGKVYLSRVWNTLMYGTIASLFGSAASTCSPHMPENDYT